MRRATGILEAIGRHARFVIAGGATLFLFTPELAGVVRPALPALVVMIYAMAMTRIDLPTVLRRALRPRRFAMLAGVSLLMLVATPAVYLWIGQALGAGPGLLRALVYTGAAPPIASSAGLCFLLGLDAAFALELTIMASLLTPLIGPVAAGWLLGEAAALDPLALGARLAAMILAGGVVAVFARKAIGPERVARRKLAFDGLAALCMLTFVLPLFDGVGPMVLAAPGVALVAVLAALAINLGAQMAVAALARRAAPPPAAGAAGVMWGNRTSALYLAALPPDPALTLFVALYQFPMYFTPLVLARFYAPYREADHAPA